MYSWHGLNAKEKLSLEIDVWRRKEERRKNLLPKRIQGMDRIREGKTDS